MWLYRDKMWLIVKFCLFVHYTRVNAPTVNIIYFDINTPYFMISWLGMWLFGQCRINYQEPQWRI